jgi:hypothetical protein
VKITGIVLVVLGLVGVIFCTVQIIDPANPNAQTTTTGADAAKPNMTIPFLVSALMIGIGGALIFFGGRGYYESYNPRVRN